MHPPQITRLAEIYPQWAAAGSGVHCIVLKGAGGKVGAQ
jgi:hypothetical protein